MLKDIEKVLKLAETRIDYLHNIDDRGFYKGYKTYIKESLKKCGIGTKF